MAKKLNPEDLLDLDELPKDATADDYAARIQAIGELRDACTERMRELTADHDVVHADAEAERKLAEMSDPERAALNRVIGAGKVASTARVGATEAK